LNNRMCVLNFDFTFTSNRTSHGDSFMARIPGNLLLTFHCMILLRTMELPFSFRDIDRFHSAFSVLAFFEWIK
jgi:hypothetical protein